jgi:hypothetical protein
MYDILTYLSIIGVILTIVGIVINYSHRRNDNIRRVIKNLIGTFVNPALDKLFIDQFSTDFVFPDSFSSIYGVGDIDGFRRFLSTKKIIGWRVKSYSLLCNSLNNKILRLSEKAERLGIIDNLVDVNTNNGYSEMVKQYKTLTRVEIDKLLKEKNLNDDIEEINELFKKLQPESRKLYKKLKQLKFRWMIRYHLLDLDF